MGQVISVNYEDVGGGSGVESIEEFTKVTTGVGAFSITTTKKAIGVIMHYTSSQTYGLFAFDGINNNTPKATSNADASYFTDMYVTFTDNAINFSKNVGSCTWKGYIVY